MKIKTSIATAVTLLAVGVHAANAEVAGYNGTAVPTGSDAFVSVPFTIECEASLTVNAVVGGSGVTVNETLVDSKYNTGLYYVRVTSGVADGKWSTITSNTTGELVLTDTSILTGIVNGDSLKVYPHQTLETVFFDGLEGTSYLASTSTFFRNGTEVLVPSSDPGTDKGAAAIYYYFDGQWRDANVFGGGDADDVILAPQSQVIVRNTSSTATLNVYTFGDVETHTQVAAIPVLGVANDVAAATGQPIARTLSQLQLGGSAAFASSSAVDAVDGDQLLVFDNAASGINKGPSATYYYADGQWLNVVGDANSDAVELPAGAAVLIRKVSGAVSTVSWKQSSPF